MTRSVGRARLVRLARAAAPVLFLALACCGGSAVRAPSGDAGVPDPAVCGGHVSGTATGRPAAAACSVSSVPPGAGADGGVLACATDSDCQADYGHTWCRAGTCQPDQCFRDTDCSSGEACACANEQVGNALHTNRCVATGCRGDADCAPGETCSPTTQDLCSGGGPFFACHSSADTCRVDADCCASAPSCRFESALGHWACVAACTIAG